MLHVESVANLGPTVGSPWNSSVPPSLGRDRVAPPSEGTKGS